MKTVFVTVCCLAIAPLLRGDPPNDAGAGVNVKQAQATAAVPQQQAVTPKVYPNQNVHYNRNLPGNPMLHGNPNARYNTPYHGQALVRQHQRQFNLSSGPNSQIASAHFRPNNHIAGSERWQGQRYDAFRSHHAQWHDRDWWRHHHNRIVLIGGGWYFWDSGFWYPAWGYDPASSYYPYDGPIYAYDDLPPDQVIANVQASLQEQGYYAGDVDGLLGPQTRAALAAYQRDHGLYMTAAIDQPTLASLGMG